MSFGFWEVMLLLLIVLIVFGAGRLPQAMGDVGRSWRAFRTGMRDEADGDAAMAGRPRAPDDSRERENGSGSS
jgi:sec-independent protein translocase protein TatA